MFKYEYIIHFLLTFYVNFVNTAGVTELVINSEVSAMIRMDGCFYDDNFCEEPNYDTVEPMEVIAGDQFIYDIPFATPTNSEARLRIQVRSLDDEKILVVDERIIIPLKRVYANFTLHTINNSRIDIGIKNICDKYYTKDTCSLHCKFPEGSHLACSDNGLVCAPGWTGYLCSKGVCSEDCNGRGTCVSTNKCECIKGFKGDQCHYCDRSDNCVNGNCEVREDGWTVPFTCQCHPGYAGENCDQYDICYHARPCRNGICTINTNITRGYECECLEGFIGIRCEIPTKTFDCSTKSDCKNGGRCVVYDNRSRCRCAVGYKGRKCDNYGPGPTKNQKDCSDVRCLEGYICIMDNSKPLCINTVTPGPFVTLKRNKSSVIYQIYYGEYHWRTRNGSINLDNAIKTAVNHSSVNVYYVHAQKEKSAEENDYDEKDADKIRNTTRKA